MKGKTFRLAVPHARSNAKKGKHRFDLSEALHRDRERFMQNKELPLTERLLQLRALPWKFFIGWMALWSWLGLYVVPYLKDGRVDKRVTVTKGSPQLSLNQANDMT